MGRTTVLGLPFLPGCMLIGNLNLEQCGTLLREEGALRGCLTLEPNARPRLKSKFPRFSPLALCACHYLSSFVSRAVFHDTLIFLCVSLPWLCCLPVLGSPLTFVEVQCLGNLGPEAMQLERKRGQFFPPPRTLLNGLT